MTPWLYLLDANVLIDANRDYYPITRVPEFWSWLVDMGGLGKVKVPLEIYEELVGGDDVLAEWLKTYRNNLLLDEEIASELVAKVTEQGYANDLTDIEIEKIGRDPFLMAYALADPGRRCVVTTEVSRPSRTRANRHIPDVCRALDIPCCNTFQLVRLLDFRTDWPPR